MPHSSRPASDLPDWLILVLGAMALALAMGIGRFAFTPLMPLMLRDGTLTAAQCSTAHCKVGAIEATDTARLKSRDTTIKAPSRVSFFREASFIHAFRQLKVSLFTRCSVRLPINLRNISDNRYVFST